jgi:hypothetical protein
MTHPAIVVISCFVAIFFLTMFFQAIKGMVVGTGDE